MRSSTYILAGISLAIAASPAAAQKPMSGEGMHVDDGVTPPNPELVFESIAACRAFDTHASSALSAPRAFTISGAANLKSQGGPNGGCGIPLSAMAVAISLGTSDASQSGTIAAYPSGKPATNNLAAAYAPSIQLVAGAIVGINNHQVTLAPSVGSTQVTGDITGYYAPQMEGYVTASGVLFSHTARVLSVSHTQTGLCQIMVDRDVSYCSVDVTSGVEYWSAAGYTSYNSIYVFTYNNVSTPVSADLQFNFSAHC